jgi:hypothetical protein
MFYSRAGMSVRSLMLALSLKIPCPKNILADTGENHYFSPKSLPALFTYYILIWYAFVSFLAGIGLIAPVNNAGYPSSCHPQGDQYRLSL